MIIYLPRFSQQLRNYVWICKHFLQLFGGDYSFCKISTQVWLLVVVDSCKFGMDAVKELYSGAGKVWSASQKYYIKTQKRAMLRKDFQALKRSYGLDQLEPN